MEGEAALLSGGLSFYFRFFTRFFDLLTIGGNPTVMFVRLDSGGTIFEFCELKGCFALI